MLANESQPVGRVRGSVEVDPALLEVIKSASRPLTGPRPPAPPRSIPGPEGGLFATLAAVSDTLRRGIVHGLELRERYGDIYCEPFAGLPIVYVWDADEIQKMLKNHDRAWSTGLGWDALMFEGLDPQVANTGSLLSLDFDDHRIARKLVQPAFAPKALEGYLRVADRHFAEALPGWVKRGAVSFKAEVRSLLARVANEIFTGLHDPEDIARVDRALSDFWRGMLAVSRNPWLSPTFRRARAGLAALIRTFLSLVPRSPSGGRPPATIC